MNRMYEKRQHIKNPIIGGSNGLPPLKNEKKNVSIKHKNATA